MRRSGGKTAEVAESLARGAEVTAPRAESDRLSSSSRGRCACEGGACAPPPPHDNDVREAKPWLFETTGKHVKAQLRHDRSQRGTGVRRGNTSSTAEIAGPRHCTQREAQSRCGGLTIQQEHHRICSANYTAVIMRAPIACRCSDAQLRPSRWSDSVR